MKYFLVVLQVSSINRVLRNLSSATPTSCHEKDMLLPPTNHHLPALQLQQDQQQHSHHQHHHQNHHHHHNQHHLLESRSENDRQAFEGRDNLFSGDRRDTCWQLKGSAPTVDWSNQGRSHTMKDDKLSDVDDDHRDKQDHLPGE